MLAEQKAAAAGSENAATAQRIKAKLLRKLEKEIDALPDLIGSETRQTLLENDYQRNEKGKVIGSRPLKTKEATKSYNIRDLTAAYVNLTKDMDLTGSNDQVRNIIDV